MLFRFLVLILLFFSPLICGNPGIKVTEEKRVQSAKDLRNKGVERLPTDQEALEVAQKIASLLLDMIYQNIDQVNQQIQKVGNQITFSMKNEGYSDEQIIKGFLIFYGQSAELLRKAIFSDISNIWKGGVISVRSNGFLLKLFGNHVCKKVHLS